MAINDAIRIEADNFTIFICQHEKSPFYFDHSDLEIMELILRRLSMIDIDLIYGIFKALDGKHLTPENWRNLIEMIREFDP